MTLQPYRPPATPFLGRYAPNIAQVMSQLLGIHTAPLTTEATLLGQDAAELRQLVEGLSGRRERMRLAWPEGAAAEASDQVTGGGILNVAEIVPLLGERAATLVKVARLLDLVVRIDDTVLRAAEPAVAAAASNPFGGQAAAFAIAQNTAATVTKVAQTIGQVLGFIGAEGIANVFKKIGDVATTVTEIFSAFTAPPAEVGAIAAAGVPAPLGPLLASPPPADVPGVGQQEPWRDYAQQYNLDWTPVAPVDQVAAPGAGYVSAASMTPPPSGDDVVIKDGEGAIVASVDLPDQGHPDIVVEADVPAGDGDGTTRVRVEVGASDQIA